MLLNHARQYILCLAAMAIMGLWAHPAPAQDSQCVQCHTSSGKLIKITRMLAKDRPVVESKSTGPG